MQQESLSYAVRLVVVFKYLSQLCLVAAALTAVPLACALLCGEYSIAVRYVVAVATLSGLGVLGWRLPSSLRVQHNEAMVIAAGMFVLTSLIMTVPLMGSGLDFFDAWFESTSAITTTGLSTRGTLASATRAFLFGRAWMQWYGGLGIVVLSLGMAMQPGLVARRLALTQADEDDFVGSTRAHARRVFIIYCALTMIGIVGLLLTGAGWLDAIVHCLAAISTGGFSTRDDSLAKFSLAAQMTTIMIAVAGSVSLPLYWLSGRKAWRTLINDVQLRALLVCGLLTTALLFALLSRNGTEPWLATMRHASLNALFAQTTAGFSTVEIAELDAGAKLVLIASMAVGGSTASTAGGFKLLRLLIVLRALQLICFRTTMPKHAVESSQVAGRRLESDEREEALCLVMLFVLVTLASWLPFLWAGFDPLDSLFEIVSAIGTVGLSTGVSASDLPATLKTVLCLDMLFGRVEFVALLVLFYPRTWIGRRMQSS